MAPSELERAESTSKSMRIALVLGEDVTEYALFVHYFLIGLADESIPVAVVCPPETNVENLISPSVEVIKSPAIEMFFMQKRNIKSLAAKLSKFDVSILHCLSIEKIDLTRQLAKSLNVPYVVTVNSLVDEEFKLSAPMPSRIVVPAETIAEHLIKIEPKTEELIERIHIGAFAKSGISCFRDENRLPTIVTMLPDSECKECEDFVDAVKELAEDGTEFLVIAIADDKAEENLRKCLHKAKIEKRFTIIPHLEPMKTILESSDIYVQLVPSNSFNTLLLEALSVGMVAVVCQGGVDDLVIDGKTCVVFDKADPKSIYMALRKIFDSRDFSHQLAKKAEDYIKQNHSVSKMITSLLRIYRHALSQENE
jgi:glycosyltransferase involved in cell wall biosynthesis